MGDVVFWGAVLLCAVAQVAIVRGSIRASVRDADGFGVVPRPRRWEEVAWTVLPAVVLALVLVMTWRAMHQSARQAPESAAAPIVRTS